MKDCTKLAKLNAISNFYLKSAESQFSSADSFYKLANSFLAKKSCALLDPFCAFVEISVQIGTERSE